MYIEAGVLFAFFVPQDSGAQQVWGIVNIVLRSIIALIVIWVGVTFLRAARRVEKKNIERTVLYLGTVSVIILWVVGVAVSILHMASVPQDTINLVFRVGFTAVTLPAVAIVTVLVLSTYRILSGGQRVFTGILIAVLLAAFVVFILVPLFSGPIRGFLKVIAVYLSIVSLVLAIGVIFTAIAFARSPWQHYFINLTVALLLIGIIGLGDFFFYNLEFDWRALRLLMFVASLALFVHSGYLRWQQLKRR
jgi:hypothetical protein